MDLSGNCKEAFLKWQSARDCLVRCAQEMADLCVAEQRARVEWEHCAQLPDDNS